MRECVRWCVCVCVRVRVLVKSCYVDGMRLCGRGDDGMRVMMTMMVCAVVCLCVVCVVCLFVV